MGDNEWGQPQQPEEDQREESQEYSEDQNQAKTKSVKKEKSGRGRGKLIFALLIIIIAAGVGAYFFMTRQVIDKVNFTLSTYEQNSLNKEADTKAFSKSDRIYIFTGRANQNLGAEAIKVSIERSAEGAYIETRNITFETDKNFKNISTFIPPAYFAVPGKYRITVHLDNAEIGKKEIEVTE